MKKVLLITGGGRGIGAAISRMAAAQGYRVAINYRDDRSRAEALAAEIEAQGGKAVAIAGKPFVSGVNTLAADGRSFTEVSWRVNAPAKTVTLVYDRQ